MPAEQVCSTLTHWVAAHLQHGRGTVTPGGSGRSLDRVDKNPAKGK